MTTQPHTHPTADTAPPASDGLTLDTPDGPGDWAVAERLLRGHHTPATPADITLAYTLARGSATRAARTLATALGIPESTALRGINRARAAAARAAAQAETPQQVAA